MKVSLVHDNKVICCYSNALRGDFTVNDGSQCEWLENHNATRKKKSGSVVAKDIDMNIDTPEELISILLLFPKIKVKKQGDNIILNNRNQFGRDYSSEDFYNHE